MIACSLLGAKEIIQQARTVTFLTGAGVSTPSGVPDYRSLKGVYQGIEAPEYLLSTTCLQQEPQKFYNFVKKLYHPEAQPNIIHQQIAHLTQTGQAQIVTQNIDELHEKAGSKHCVNFHGTLYQCHCRKCQQKVSWQEYLKSDLHEGCGGQIRPEIVLYGENLPATTVDAAIQAVEQAELIVICGTSFQVQPFCQLIHYKQSGARILVVNQSKITLPYSYDFLQEEASRLFLEL